MVLADHDIHLAKYLISPFKSENVQPASVDLTLDRIFLTPQALPVWRDSSLLDPLDLEHTGDTYNIEADKTILHPQAYMLGSTAETVTIPSHLVASIEGKSSLARLGLFVHITAGFIDPGFRGKVTLELVNMNRRPILLTAGMKICQIAFTILVGPVDRPYGTPGLGSHYQDQTETTSSRYDG